MFRSGKGHFHQEVAMESALTLRKTAPPELSDESLAIHHVSVLEVEFGHGALSTMQRAMKEVAAQTGVSYDDVMHRLNGHMYWVESTGTLLCVIPLPDNDLYLEIPEDFWRIRERSYATH
jgi:hypothetical protein